MEKLKSDFKISFIRGDTYALAVKFKNITEDLRLAFFTVKENPSDTPLIQKSLGAGIDKIDDRAYKNEKTYKIQLQPTDTLNLEARVQYLYDFQVTVGNVVKTVLSGVFALNHTVTGTDGATTETLNEVVIDDEIEAEVLTTPATKGIEYETDAVALAKIGDIAGFTTSAKGTVVQAVNEVNSKTATNANEIVKIKDGTIRVPKATEATTATSATYAGADTSKGTIDDRLNEHDRRLSEFTLYRHTVSIAITPFVVGDEQISMYIQCDIYNWSDEKITKDNLTTHLYNKTSGYGGYYWTRTGNKGTSRCIARIEYSGGEYSAEAEYFWVYTDGAFNDIDKGESQGGYKFTMEDIQAVHDRVRAIQKG